MTKVVEPLPAKASNLEDAIEPIPPDSVAQRAASWPLRLSCPF